MKLMVNQAYENMGLASTQTLGPILDGLMRNIPEAERFIETAEAEGVPAAVAERDGPFGDYSQAAAGGQARPAQRDRALGRSVLAPQRRQVEVVGARHEQLDAAGERRVGVEDLVAVAQEDAHARLLAVEEVGLPPPRCSYSALER